MQADTSPEQAAAPSDLVALVMALRLLVGAFEATAQSRPARALLAALRGLFHVVEHYQADPTRRRLEASVVDDGDDQPVVGLASLPIAPRAPSSSTTATDARGAAAQPLPAFQRGAISDLVEAFEGWGRVDQLVAGLDLTLRALDPARPIVVLDLKEYSNDLRHEVFALGGSLCELSATLGGLSVQASPLSHAVQLRQLLDADDPPWLRQRRDREARERAARAFAATG